MISSLFPLLIAAELSSPHLDCYEVVQEAQYEHLGRVEAAVSVPPLGHQRVEVFAVLRQPIRHEDWVT